MKIHRRIALVHLCPVVEFSFTENGRVYKLVKRSASRRSDHYTLVLKDMETKEKKNRHFSFDSLMSTVVYLRDEVKTSRQPKTNICITICCL